MQILGIETSCDETAAAIVKDGTKIIANIVASSVEFHKKTGGVIPEVAAREQVSSIIPVIDAAMSNIKCQMSNLDAIAVTVGPGLLGSLLVGVETTKTLSYAWKKPVVPVNHLLGHIYANFVSEISNINSEVEFPALVLVVSGGHTDLVLMEDHGKLKWLGGTRDDAAGEAFDKIARLLELGYPGGPAIAAEAAKLRIENSEFRMFPRAMINEDNFDLSFSGLKTAVFREVQKRGGLSEKEKQRLAVEVQEAIVDVLVAKTLKAAKKYKVKSILLAGGVAANDLLRHKLGVSSKELEVKFFAPAKNLCTDNAAMIASAAFFNYKPVPWGKIKVDPNLHF